MRAGGISAETRSLSDWPDCGHLLMMYVRGLSKESLI